MFKEGVAERKEIYIGFRQMSFSSNVVENSRIQLNPTKERSITLNQEDCLIVLAEDDL